MIPTSHKAKLSQELSYPIGAGAISEALAGAPHAESLTVTFLDRPVRLASEFRRLLAARLPYTILAAEHWPASRPGFSAPWQSVECGRYDEKWELQVYPVLRELRQLASRLLREQGLPAVAQWLRSSDRPGWRVRHQRLELAFDPANESLPANEVGGV